MVPTEFELTKEFAGPPSADELAYAFFARAGVLNFKSANGNLSTMPPVNGALTGTSVALALAPKTTYRVIATSAMHVRMSKPAGTAVTTDTYIPAKTAFFVRTEDKWASLEAIKAAGEADGIVQATPVL